MKEIRVVNEKNKNSDTRQIKTVKENKKEHRNETNRNSGMKEIRTVE